MKLFKNVDYSFFTPERALVLEDFSRRVEKYIDEYSNGYFEHLSDVIIEDETLWGDIEQAPYLQIEYALWDSRGGLDVIAAAMASGMDLEQVWERILSSSFESMQKDLMSAGLHGIHFRMNIANASDRITYTRELAKQIFNPGYESAFVGMAPMTGLSTQSKGSDELLAKMMAHFSYASESIHVDEIEARILLGWSSVPEGDPDHLFDIALAKMLKKNSEYVSSMSRPHLAGRIESSLFPLVYNLGYQLKADGVPIPEIISAVSKNIEALLLPLGLNLAFEEALERQILVNLFSPFPDGLEFLGARPEELQGVVNPEHMSHPDFQLFKKTFDGPLEVFSAALSAPIKHQAYQIISYLSDSGFPINLGTAAKGTLLGSRVLVELIRAEPVSCVPLDAQICAGESGLLHNDVVTLLAVPKQLALLSDTGIVEILAEVLIRSGGGKGACRSTFEQPTNPIGSVISSRPGLKEKVLGMLKEKEALKPDVFEWCGFGHKELRLLGREAPYELKKSLLENDLGM
jgi:hypothetical protein